MSLFGFPASYPCLRVSAVPPLRPLIDVTFFFFSIKKPRVRSTPVWLAATAVKPAPPRDRRIPVRSLGWVCTHFPARLIFLWIVAFPVRFLPRFSRSILCGGHAFGGGRTGSRWWVLLCFGSQLMFFLSPCPLVGSFGDQLGPGSAPDVVA